MKTVTGSLAIAWLIVGLCALASAQMKGHDHPASTSRAAKGSDTPSTKDYKAAHARMMKEMDISFSGDPDVDFRKHMIPHHQGAIDMAEAALRHAKDPETKKMAQKIIDDQKIEIAEMQAWLKARGK